MTVSCRIDLETVRITVTASIDISGKCYSDRKMAWLRKELENHLVILVETQLPVLSWADTS